MRPSSMPRTLVWVASVLPFALGLAGCSTSQAPTTPMSGATFEQNSIATALSADPNFLADGLIDAGTPTSATGARPAGSAAAIAPLTFWRSITGSELAFTFVFADSDSAGRPRQADVTVTRHFTGTFNIVKALPGDPPTPDTANVIHKPLADTWVRHLQLRRLPLGDHGSTAWRLVAASLVEVTSSNAASQILSVRVQGPECDTTVTDPAALWTLPRVRVFAPGDSLTFTATTGNADDVVLAYWHDRRERFHSNGDGTHTFVLHIGDGESGWRWFAVNALSNGTLFDDALPYDSKAWAVGCFVGARPAREYF